MTTHLTLIPLHFDNITTETIYIETHTNNNMKIGFSVFIFQKLYWHAIR